MQLTIDEKRVLVRILEKVKPANLCEINLLKNLTRNFQYDIDSEQAAIMFPISKIEFLNPQRLLKAA